MTIRAVALLVVLVLLLVALSGCALQPQAIRAEWQHVSTPSEGWPVSAPSNEDSLDQLNVMVRWHYEHVYLDAGLGCKLAEGGFYGPDLQFTSRIGYEWSLR